MNHMNHEEINKPLQIILFYVTQQEFLVYIYTYNIYVQYMYSKSYIHCHVWLGLILVHQTYTSRPPNIRFGMLGQRKKKRNYLKYSQWMWRFFFYFFFSPQAQVSHTLIGNNAIKISAFRASHSAVICRCIYIIHKKNTWRFVLNALWSRVFSQVEVTLKRGTIN